MGASTESRMSTAIVDAYHRKLTDRLESDVVIVGAGPSGLVAAWHLARQGVKVAVLEKRLAPGGGIWGGAAGMNEVVVQQAAAPILDELDLSTQPAGDDLCTLDAMALACALCLRAVQAGAVLFNLMMAEDLCVREGRVRGVVANRTALTGSLPIDPVVFSAQAVLDATGHDAFLVHALARRGLFGEGGKGLQGEGALDVEAGEAFVVDRADRVFPGLWISGMAVCATFGGPRMGPIFGGMLRSGEKVARLIAADLAESGGTKAAKD